MDPLTKKPYGYLKLDDKRYEIRVEFELPSSALEKEGLTLPDRRWRHPAGEHRMDFTLKDRDDSSLEYR